QDLLVLALLVGHPEQPDGARPDPAPGERRLADEHERVEGIAVAAERAFDEAVIGGVAHGGEQHPVEVDLPADVVHLVLVARTGRDLDDHRHLVLAHAAESSQGPERYHQGPMAGNTVRPAPIGVGPALRRAREIGGTSLEEAARDTKLTVEQLEGLETED